MDLILERKMMMMMIIFLIRISKEYFTFIISTTISKSLPKMDEFLL
jgi:hypothetical protein